MRVRRISALLGTTAVVLAALTAPAAAKPGSPADAALDGPGAQGLAVAAAARACPHARAGYAACDALFRAHPDGKPVVTQKPVSYAPSDLQAAYKLTTAMTAGVDQTIAIVDAYDNPNAEGDLGVYRAQYGLDVCAATDGCFRKVNQTGGSTPPATDVGWGQEIALDLDMASAICPRCHLLLVEADSNSLADLGAAVNTAAALGATVISNSYGGSDLPDSTYGAAYDHPGIPITASTGDNGYGVQFPASSAYVTAVGGTSLRRSSAARGWTETAWSGAGSGCSSYNVKPSWQTDTGCGRRAVADVSAVADPNTGVNVYDTFGSASPAASWMVFGGTSASAPIIAAVYALAGNGASTVRGSFPYSHRNGLFDVTSGSNGRCKPAYLCTAAVGFDGPTGLGTPSGLGAF